MVNLEVVETAGKCAKEYPGFEVAITILAILVAAMIIAAWRTRR